MAPEDQQNVEKIVFEKTSALLNSNIIVAKQRDIETSNLIKKTISNNKSQKFFNGILVILGENGFFIMRINLVD